MAVHATVGAASRALIRGITGQFRKDAVKEWKRMVRESDLPPAFKKAYLAAIRVQRTSDGFKLSLQPSAETDTMVRSAEYGFGPGGVGTAGPYDMRKTLLKSQKGNVRVSKKGHKYMNVPMRRTTAKVVEYGGRDAYDQARALEPTRRRQDMYGRWRGKFRGSLPAFAGKSDILQKGWRSLHGEAVPPHKNDPLQRLYKFQPRGARQATYGNFRRISEGGKAWIHPGVRARRFMRRMQRKIIRMAQQV